MTKKSYAEEYLEQHGNEPWFKKILFIQDFLGDIVMEMERKGMTQAELAKRSGIHPTRISRVLHNDEEKNITVETMIKLADAVGLEIHISLTRKDTGRAKANKENLNPKVV